MTVGAKIVGSDNKTVEVSVTQTAYSQFPGLLNQTGSILSVTSTATLSGSSGKICVIALDTSSTQTIYMKSNALLTAQTCNVYSNSKSPSGIYSDSGITLSASLSCSSGGFYGQGVFRGQRLTDCPPRSDPLEQRVAPAIGACKPNNDPVIDKGRTGARHRLTPGTYCGGLRVDGNSFVEFEPGVYIIKDGPLVVDSNSDVIGKHVGFYFVGDRARLRLAGNAKVNFDAPKDGPLSGLLFFEDRAAPLLRLHEITTNNASNMTGTIYFPRGRFVVDATNEVAQQSAFTVIIARQILLTASPRLTLNTNYHQTTVPVPAGIKETSSARLVE